MDGPAVFRFATRVMVDSTRRLLDACGLAIGDVDWFVPHQANIRIIDNAVKRLGADPDRVLMNLERYGNTSAASIPLCLEEAWSDGRLKKGDRVLMIGFGGGLTWGSCLTEWAASNAPGAAG
jgi:3-oxoacyl-[acyl-carrier-protein] synthase-3